MSVRLGDVEFNNNPEPWLNPVSPYSIFQELSEPPAFQDKSALLEVILLAARLFGWGHVTNVAKLKGPVQYPKSPLLHIAWT